MGWSSAQLKNIMWKISWLSTRSYENPLAPSYYRCSRLCLSPDPTLTQGPGWALAMHPQVVHTRKFSSNNSICCLPLPQAASSRLHVRGRQMRHFSAVSLGYMLWNLNLPLSSGGTALCPGPFRTAMPDLQKPPDLGVKGEVRTVFC